MKPCSNVITCTWWTSWSITPQSWPWPTNTTPTPKDVPIAEKFEETGEPHTTTGAEDEGHSLKGMFSIVLFFSKRHYTFYMNLYPIQYFNTFKPLYSVSLSLQSPTLSITPLLASPHIVTSYINNSFSYSPLSPY